MDITLTPEAEARLNKFADSHGWSPGEAIEQALELLEDYQRWEDEQDLAEIAAVRQEIKQEGTVPWETVKANLGL